MTVSVNSHYTFIFKLILMNNLISWVSSSCVSIPNKAVNSVL